MGESVPAARSRLQPRTSRSRRAAAGAALGARTAAGGETGPSIARAPAHRPPLPALRLQAVAEGERPADPLPRPAAHVRQRATHARSEPRVGAEASRALGPEDHGVPLRPPAPRLHEVRGGPAPVQARPAGAGAAGEGCRGALPVWHAFVGRRCIWRAAWYAGGTEPAEPQARGRNPSRFRSDSGLMDGGVCGTRTRGLRRDRQPKGLAASGSGSQQAAITGSDEGTDSQGSPQLAGLRPPRVTPELQSRSALGVTPERLLTVREVAARLGVCTSTVYKLCNEGKLAHVRVSNAIRVDPSAVEALGRRP